MNDWTKLRDIEINWPKIFPINSVRAMRGAFYFLDERLAIESYLCLLYTSPSPRDKRQSRMPSSA